MNTTLKRITLIAAARPNFMKVAPIIHALNKSNGTSPWCEWRLVHTGQHYDHSMSGTFFEQLRIPIPHTNLECGGGTQAEQTASVMIGLENELKTNPCDVMVVVGDVTSTMAAAITCKKLCVELAHVEAGIRSGDRTMPEEINRIVTDSITDIFFTTTSEASRNLLREGKDQAAIHFVGNVMIDSLLSNLSFIRPPQFPEVSKLCQRPYFLLTLHRPSNVDDRERLHAVLKAISESTRDVPVIFPVHPRTRKKLAEVVEEFPNIIYIEPCPYLEFIHLVKHAKAILTDSGGITEEATVLNVPCITLRDSTERPETITYGTNRLIGNDCTLIRSTLDELFDLGWKNGSTPPLWDGHASERIVKVLQHGTI